MIKFRTLWDKEIVLDCLKVKVLVIQSCPTSCDPMDCSPPSSSVHGVLQARILEWVAIPFSRESSQSRDRTWVSCIAGEVFTVWVMREAPHLHHMSLWDRSRGRHTEGNGTVEMWTVLMQPQAKECQQPPEAERGKDSSFFLEGTLPHQISDFWPLELWQ